jgi:hypothetical protein
VERQPSKLDVAGSNPVSRSSPFRPAAFCFGRGHVLMYANPDMRVLFGECQGLPAREALSLPTAAFAVMDLVLERGRPLARWIHRDGADWRLTAAPRIDPETDETYGVRIHLRERSDQPHLTRADTPTD